MSKKEVSEEEMARRIMNGEVPDMGDGDDAVGRAILDGKMPNMHDMESDDAQREADIAKQILDGAITNVDGIDAGQTVNRGAAIFEDAWKKKEEMSAEDAEIARRIMNGEMP